ncbi:YbaN family protein [Clostridium gasigenes]|uniref:YbaN family protein n=1 Tax=Clostridium gasigenes TaxID=94869 RepID=UPI001C0E6266|nr:YbaN family protein [Clostridium gasigenes]MBU3105912.1 YbaN family protein [Clostridium gasigenes]
MNKIKKGIYISIGLICVAIGAVGVVLPVLPTTPFLLLASACFVKGSDKFDRWFKGTKLYKNNLETFVNNRSMKMKTKVSILLFADVMIAFPLVILDSLIMKGTLILLMLFKYYYFMFKIKTIKVAGAK